MPKRASSTEDMAPSEKGRSLELAPELAPETPDDSATFDALLYPNRSLPNSGFVAVMSIVIAANIVFGILFFSIGAWPVIGFCGLDVFLVWLAFKLSYRQGRLRERVSIRDGELRVSRVLPSGHESRWRLQAAWTRVIIDNPRHHESRVRVVSKGRSLILGAFLSPDERMAFGATLAAAVARAGNARGA
ncbi:MAG: DUF2244 domain-containing protein [Parvularculaceae bacterium]